MKFLWLLFTILAASSIEAEPQKVSNDRERWNIRGPVKTLEDSWHELVREGKKVVSGKSYRDMAAEQSVFNKSGNVIERNSGDTRTKLEPIEGETKVRMITFDDDGKVNNTRIVVTAFDELGYPGQVKINEEDGKPTYKQIYLRKENSMEIKSEIPGIPGPPLIITYIYDQEGRVARRKFFSMNGKESTWDYEWKKFDQFGNGIEAHVRIDDEESPSMIHLVKFTYH